MSCNFGVCQVRNLRAWWLTGDPENSWCGVLEAEILPWGTSVFSLRTAALLVASLGRTLWNVGSWTLSTWTCSCGLRVSEQDGVPVLLKCQRWHRWGLMWYHWHCYLLSHSLLNNNVSGWLPNSNLWPRLCRDVGSTSSVHLLNVLNCRAPKGVSIMALVFILELQSCVIRHRWPKVVCPSSLSWIATHNF